MGWARLSPKDWDAGVGRWSPRSSLPTDGARRMPFPLTALIRLARPAQWSKGVFVLIGPVYGLVVNPQTGRTPDAGVASAGWWGVAAAFFAFALASSFCYVVNDLVDREADRAHPRKKHRPLASGAVTVPVAIGFALVLLALAGVCVGLAPNIQTSVAGGVGWPSRAWLGIAVGVYVLNVLAYSITLKHRVVADVMSLALGFVLRVLGGCAAAGVEPSTWLLNVTFFASMFLALGKRLGERRTLGDNAAAARGVHAFYTDDLLRMGVVVTGVACLLTYAAYVQDRAAAYTHGFNLLWLTMLPATYGLLRCMVLLERGRYDDPTEIGLKDRGTLLAAVVFGAMTIGLWWFVARGGSGG